MSAVLTLDATFRGIVGGFDEPLRAYAATLPHRIGVARDPDGQWEDFWVLAPNRDAPAYANEAAGEAIVADERLERFRAAHHAAVVFGLLADRLADRQVEPDARLSELLRRFHDAWGGLLASAAGSEEVARAAVDAALDEWRLGTALEYQTLRARSLDPATYATQTMGKLRWGSVAGACLLVSAGEAARVPRFRRCFDLFGVSIQCTDDALDAAEDQRLHGVSVPQLLGVPEGALMKAALPLAEEAEEEARGGGFLRLAQWLGKWRVFLENARPTGDPSENLARGRCLGDKLAEAL